MKLCKSTFLNLLIINEQSLCKRKSCIGCLLSHTLLPCSRVLHLHFFVLRTQDLMQKVGFTYSRAVDYWKSYVSYIFDTTLCKHITTWGKLLQNSNTITEKHFQNLCSYSRRNITVRVHHSFLGIFIKNVGFIPASVIISKKLRSKLQRLCIKNSLLLRNILHGTSRDTRSL